MGLRAVTVADFYHRGGNGPTIAGGAVLCIFIYTVGTESIQTPLIFSLFVILQPFAKIIWVHFFSSLMYTQHPILTEKHRIVDIFADLLKKKNWNITWS